MFADRLDRDGAGEDKLVVAFVVGEGGQVEREQVTLMDPSTIGEQWTSSRFRAIVTNSGHPGIRGGAYRGIVLAAPGPGAPRDGPAYPSRRGIRPPAGVGVGQAAGLLTGLAAAAPT